jgi:hypothetical protein
MKNDISMGSMNRHKLIDCTEFFSKSMAKTAATARTTEVHNKNMSIQRTNSIFRNLNDTFDESYSLIKQHRSKSLLAKDFNE